MSDAVFSRADGARSLSSERSLSQAITAHALAESLYAVIPFLMRHLDSLPDLPPRKEKGVAAFLEEHAGGSCAEQGCSLDELVAIVEQAAPLGFNNGTGKCLAYIPGSGLPISAVADLISGVVNAFTGASRTSPGLVELERNVLRWLCDAMGLPEGSGGLLTSGGSLATISALVAARDTHFREDGFAAGVMYVTEQTHHCVNKAARITGFSSQAIRTLPTDERSRMDVAALRRAIEDDLAQGRKPFLVVANAGTTNAGTVDPLDAIADVAAEHGLWFHVDGAYGGCFRLTERGHSLFKGIERADSLVIDPHKGLFLPFGTGCLLVRDPATLLLAHGGFQAAYLRDADGTVSNEFVNLGPELTRPNRGLRLWLAINLYGVAAFREALDEKLDLARVAYDALDAMPGLRTFGPPDLSIVCFHVHRPQAGREEENRLTDALLERVNAMQNVLLSSTVIEGRIWIRLVALSLNTVRQTIDIALNDIRAALEDVA